MAEKRTIATARAAGKQMSALAGQIAADRPSTSDAQVPAKTQAYTLLTVPAVGTTEIHAAKQWTKVRLRLTTAGPVDVGTSSAIAPVLSGKGIELTPGIDTEITLSPGDRLYYATATVNRLSVTLEPFAFLDQIVALQRDALGVAKTGAEFLRGVFSKITGGRKAPAQAAQQPRVTRRRPPR